MVMTVATDIELIVISWLNKRKIDYEFQSWMSGGFYELGGIVVDILIPDLQLAWRVSGEYWHHGVVPEGKAEIQREQLEAEGWTVVDLWGDDILNRPDETMLKALRGEEMLT